MHRQPVPDNQQLVAKVEAWLAEYVPRFLSNRRRDVQDIHEAILRGDFDTVRRLGHNLKGVGGGYGFEPISELGQALEGAAKRSDSLEAQALCDALEHYLKTVHVITDG